MSQEVKCEKSNLQDFTDSETEQDDTVTEFKSCSYRCHKRACFKYPKNKVPINFFEGNKKTGSNGFFNECKFCRIFRNDEAKKLKARKLEPKKIVTEEPDIKEEIGKSGEVRRCTNTSHNGLTKSPYPQSSTPIELFMGNKNSPDGMFKTCKDCRDCRRKTRMKSNVEKYVKEGKICPECKEADYLTGRSANIDRCPICVEKLLEEDEENENKNFMRCPHPRHETSGCTFSKLRVPISLFKRNPDDPDSLLYKHCKYCRDYNRKCNQAVINRKSSGEIYQNLDVSTFKMIIIRTMVKYLVYYPELILNKNIEKILLELLYQFNLTTEFPEVVINIYFFRKENTLISLSGLTHQCAFVEHDKTISPFNISKVPIEFFRKDPEDIFSRTYVYCSDCREYINPGVQLFRKKKKQEIKDSRTNPKAEFLSCLLNPSVHVKCSKYPPDKVPINLFRFEEDNVHSSLFLSCKDCRCYLNVLNNKLMKKKKEKAAADGKFFCSSCHLIKELNERGINSDSSFSTFCIPCKENSFIKRKEKQKKYKEIKFNFITRINSCCENCNKIFLVVDSKIVRLETKVIENKRIVTYDGIVYEAAEFILKYKDLIELALMDLDHLPEADQRARGLLKDDEKYVPKKKHISAMGGPKAMELEARKCQLLCCECHCIITEKREIEKRGSKENSGKSVRKIEKENYVNTLKATGCSTCYYVGHNRFMDLDHINPLEKVACISNMVDRHFYSLDQVKEECKKSRVLCKFCHRLHTRKQRKEGIICNRRKNKKESSELLELSNEEEKELCSFDSEEELENFFSENEEEKEFYPSDEDEVENFLIENRELEEEIFLDIEELFLDIEETKEEFLLSKEDENPQEDGSQEKVVKCNISKVKIIKKERPQKPQQNTVIKFVKRHK